MAEELPQNQWQGVNPYFNSFLQMYVDMEDGTKYRESFFYPSFHTQFMQAMLQPLEKMLEMSSWRSSRYSVTTALTVWLKRFPSPL